MAGTRRPVRHSIRLLPNPRISVREPAQFLPDANRRFRGIRVPKPRVPWKYPRRHVGLSSQSCGNRKIVRRGDPPAAVIAAWFKKNCGPRRAAREFNTGGPESGTLYGARRAPGLFDENWGQDFPLTRREQQALQEGREVASPFFAPPTYAYAGNWINDQIERLRLKMAPTLYTTANDINKLCGKGGNGITCEGPDGGIGWSSETATLTPEIMAMFREAYCKPGTCNTKSVISPPPGFTERIIKGKPRNPGPAGRVKCAPEPAADVNGPDFPPLPPLNSPDPNAEAVPVGCVPDIIIRQQTGIFESGWWEVYRNGTRLLVPNPLTCPV